MKIIKDLQKQINLHPLVIYFVLSSKDSKERAEALNKLNKYQGFTRGIFKFQTIDNVGKYSEAVSSELTDAIKRCNMLVRLVDDDSDSFHYAVHKVNFNLSADEVEYSIQNFIVDVCKQNIKQLASQETAYSQQGVSREKQMAMRQMQQSFHYAMTLQGYRHGIWARLTDEERVVDVRCVRRRMIDSDANDMPRAFEEKFKQAAKTDNPEYLWSWLESYMNAPDKEESDEIAKGCYDTEHDKFIRRDICRRTRPKEEPVISVEIKHIVKRVLKNGKEKKQYGFVFMVNGESYPLCFEGRDQTMLYACALLRQKMGKKMYLHEFNKNTKGKKSIFQREKSRNWLKAVFNSILPYDAKGFEQWIANVQEKGSRPLNQAKPRIASCIADTFADQPSAIYFCSVDTREDEIGDSYYDIKIPSKKITIPENMQFLIDEFDELMGL